ncbi:MAG: PH domain-containing protein [bacterium]|nr:PH domain-containing protein [bacterium]
MGKVYEEALKFKRKYPGTVAWRIKKHCARVEEHLNPDEEVLYVFLGQKNNKFYDIISTSVFVITNKRLLIANDRLLFGYFLYSITPDMFNDLTVYSGLIWGMVTIDTIKEMVYVSNLSKRCLDEIETNVTEYMMEEKKEYPIRDKVSV